jgi:hypothetical protein
MKTLVLYVFHEFNKRVEFFINTALFQDENVDFVFICNNKNIEFQVPEYVKVIKRDNIGFDFGGWSDALLTNELYKNYDNFIFVNSSVIGPFINPIYKDRWTTIYLNRLTQDIKLFGSTINTINAPLTQSHVQSFIFAMNKETLIFLIEKKIFTMNSYCRTIQDAVNTKEILMSRSIIQNGWNIGCLHKYYGGVDFRFIKRKPHQYRKPFLDNMMQHHYMNKIWLKEELVFVKGHLYGI